MLKIISGSFYSNASLALREEIKDKVLNKKHAILIVPEQQTVAAEGEMAMLLSENAPLFFEVTNFTRLANSVFRSLGGIDKEYCDGAKKALIMWRTLTELSPALSMTDGRREINYGMVKRALSALGEADSLTIDANALMEAKKEIGENDRLCNKINDLALITSLYKKLLSEKYADTGEDVSEAVKRLADSPSHFSGTAVFVEGFTSFTEPQYALIGLLTERCDVTVLLDVTKSREDAFEFCEPQDTRKRLAAIANKAGVEAKLVRYDGRFNARTELTVIHDLLWQTFGKIDDPDMKPEESTFIYEAASPYEACDFVVADIKKKVLAGASFSDFAIVAANADKYVGILDVSAKRAGVPIFVSAKSDVSSYEAIKLIYAALRCVTGDFQREDVISYAKCGLSSISRDDCDKFEMYAHTWQINGKRFSKFLPK